MQRKAASFRVLQTILFGVAVAISYGSTPRAGRGAASASVNIRTGTPFSGHVYPLNLSTVPRRSYELAGNETAIIDFCLEYVEAQLEYFRSSRNANGILVFAQKLRSTPGERDGLYWPISHGDDESPLGPNVADAAFNEQPEGLQPRALSGYYLKILLAQGPAAVGGVRDYRVGGRLLTGFALIAWPAQYGVTGTQSFVVSHLGDVYARDLGPATARVAAACTRFNPDRRWTKVASVDDDDR
jgi:hypothetical protein